MALGLSHLVHSERRTLIESAILTYSYLIFVSTRWTGARLLLVLNTVIQKILCLFQEPRE